MYKDKGRIRVKKLSKMLSNMNPDKNLGPYKGGKYKAKNSQEIKLTHCNFNDLKEGLNEEKVVLGVVVCSIQDEDNVPLLVLYTLNVFLLSHLPAPPHPPEKKQNNFIIIIIINCFSTFIMVDKNESTIVVTVYNLAQEKGVLIGDYVAVPEPYLTLIHIPFEDKVKIKTK